jgi:hypothetical protein
MENYFRRRVTDLDGLTKLLGAEPKGPIKRAIDAKRREKGRNLTQEETNSAVRGALREGGGDPFKKQRTIETVTPEMTEFYADPLDELASYIRNTSQTIAKKKALGIVDGMVDEHGQVIDVTDESIASMVGEMVGENKLDDKQERELTALLKSEIGQKGAPKLIRQFHKAVSIKYVTRLKTTVTQLADVIVAVGENNLINVVSRSEVKSFTDELRNDVKLSLQSIDINPLDAELQETKRGMAERLIFAPLTGADIVGKKVMLDSTAQKWKSMSKGNPDKLSKLLMRKFNDQAFVDKVIADMQNDTLSGDVTLALYMQMANLHPVSHSEHIKFYIDNPNLLCLEAV